VGWCSPFLQAVSDELDIKPSIGAVQLVIGGDDFGVFGRAAIFAWRNLFSTALQYGLRGINEGDHFSVPPSSFPVNGGPLAMTRPWRTIDEEITDEGTMILLQQGEGDFIIRMDHYILMTSRYSLSEVALGQQACRNLASHASPRVLVAGLGMGFTLRAVIDVLGPGAEVVVAELNPVVAEWCRGPLAKLTDSCLDDSRIKLCITDVNNVISTAVRERRPFDAIVLDLYQGTHDANDSPNEPHYGSAALKTKRRALAEKGVLAVWTEERDVRFEKRLGRIGFEVERHQPGKGGPRHVIYLAWRDHKPGSQKGAKGLSLLPLSEEVNILDSSTAA
jgi:spermidine synthase